VNILHYAGYCSPSWSDVDSPVVWLFSLPGGGYGYDDGGALGQLTYYEPSVSTTVAGDMLPSGTVRGGDHRPTGGGGHASAHAYRSAPASHSMPSMPSRARSGGSRSR